MNSIFLFETILFHQKRPCYYRIFADGEVVYGEPVPHHFYLAINFPSFTAKKIGNEWMVNGLKDEQMISQIIKELDSHFQLNTANQLSATDGELIS